MNDECDEYEKPMLGCQPCSEKLPLILSSEDVSPPIQVPASITQYLRDYQLDGVRFLYKRFKAGEGGILGDDMGLGKTIQAIAFIAAVLQMKGTKEDKLRHCMPYIREDVAPGIELPSVNPVLIICPASLTDNWLNELQTWAHFGVLKLITSNRLDVINRAKRKECDVVLITFELARSSIEFLNTVDWTCVMVDEVHRIKESGSQVTKALCSLKCQIRFGLTGTPFQNNLKEVLCLLNWSNPQSSSDFNTFANDISRAVELGNRSSATKREKVNNVNARIRFQQLKRTFMKRRTKDILAKHLPPKTDQVVFCDLSQTQKEIYKMITELPGLQKLLCNSKDKNAQKKKVGLLFTYLHLLQKTANHVGLLLSGLSSQMNKVTQNVCRQALEEYAGLDGIPEKKWMDALSDSNMSGKMLVLSQLLPVFLERKDKILIFSYSTKVLDFVQGYLNKMRYKFSRLDGTTPANLRFPMVQSFNSSPDLPIFLLSTKAGGEGLNLTAANVVIIYDPNWNPAHDMQAQARAHRLGQQRSVRVYRLLSTSTIEEFVYLRQVYKQQLGSCSMTNKNVRRYFDGISGDTRYYGELFGIKNLFSFREDRGSLTEELILKQQQLEDKLRLKLEMPVKEREAEAYVAECAVLDKWGEENTKSGLVQLCQDVFETHDNLVEDEQEDWPELEAQEDAQISSNLENKYLNAYEDGEEEDGEDPRNTSIDTLLEKSVAVRHVIQHQEVVASSKVEEFVTDCAIRDVLQKGINSQLPAFDCSIETQNIPLQQESKEDTTCTVLSRFKFIQIAREEFLTPLELATRVMSMSREEKVALLNKHQKRQQVVSDVKSMHKRIRIPSEHVAEAILPKKKMTEVPLTSILPPLQSDLDDAAPHERIDFGRKLEDLDCDTSSEHEKPSSFEKEAKAVCPGLSREAILLVEQVICKKKKKGPPSELVLVTQENAKNTLTLNPPSYDAYSKDCSDKLLNSYDECTPTSSHNDNHNQGIDHETGCSLEAVSLIGSMFVNSVKKPSPKKNERKSLPVNFEASTSQFAASSLEPNESLFKAEDDVYLKLIRSGKLKRL